MASQINRQSLAPRIIPEVPTLVPQQNLSAGLAQTRHISSKDLLGNESSLVIDHEGVSYVLRATRLGKLILTK